MQSPYISNTDLKIVKELILYKTEEACGFLLESETNQLRLYIDSYGTEEKGRGMCQHSKYTKYIWHTHTNIHKGYPSAEDIVKILKWRANDFPRVSVLFTPWGIWEIFTVQKVTIPEYRLQQILNDISHAFDGLYHITEKGMGMIKNIEEFIGSTINAVTYYINNALGIKTFSMTFTMWERIHGSYTLITNRF